MAFWVVGGGGPHPATDSSGRSPYAASNYSQHSDYPDRGYNPAFDQSSEPGIGNERDHWAETRHPPEARGYGFSHSRHYEGSSRNRHSEPEETIQVKNLAFLVIQQRSPTPDPQLSSKRHAPPLADRPFPLERTESGLSIASDAVHPPHDDDNDTLISDLAAARLVRDHAEAFRRRWPDSQHFRILNALINPKTKDAEFPLDNDALRSLFSAANELFFANRLSRRVTWDWSHPASVQYESHIVGTTALRRSASLGGFETLIILSSPILKDTKYNRRLLISTFLHEMIHSFLFVTCGLKARECGGHTEGFRQIAEVIDGWVGRENLRLRDMDADLERFRDDHVLPPPAAHNYFNSSHVSMAQTNTRYPPPEAQYFPEPRIVRQHERGEWKWLEQEGFWVRDTQAARSPYVY